MVTDKAKLRSMLMYHLVVVVPLTEYFLNFQLKTNCSQSIYPIFLHYFDFIWPFIKAKFLVLHWKFFILKNIFNFFLHHIWFQTFAINYFICKYGLINWSQLTYSSFYKCPYHNLKFLVISVVHFWSQWLTVLIFEVSSLKYFFNYFGSRFVL